MSAVAIERRDVAARQARDRLGDMVGLHPRRLAALDAELAALLAARYESVERALEQAQRDALTGALIRSVGIKRLAEEIARAQRGSSSLCLLFVDVDGMKDLNDRHGHIAGDRALRLLGSALADNLRPYDTVVRWGGDEFIAILPDCGQQEAERIGARIAQAFHEQTGQDITLGCECLQPGDRLEDLVTRADADMYQRKRLKTGGA